MGTVWVTADEWFAGGRRIGYDPEHARTGDAGVLKVFERATPAAGADAVWLTMLPGFPDGSYGWAQVDHLLPESLGPRLYVEPIGQGDSDKPRHYPHSTAGRADLVEALWRHHGVRRTVVVTFDYSSLALLELLRRDLEPTIEAVFIVNGGLYADAHTHPWQGTPMLRSPLGVLGARGIQRSVVPFVKGWQQARMYARDYRPTDAELTELWSALTRRDARGSSTTAPVSCGNTAGTRTAGTSRRSPVRWTDRSRCTSAAVPRTRTSTGRSMRPANVFLRRRSSRSQAVT
ncbi:alpha/beta fold hydrolase [Kribbella sp. GL6]|uniref:alpha/beta fold hydrolase n=1 Tax=Kribbella sp. GL6 TaxID=3419765 RepID=UPI003D0613F5